MSYYNQLHNTTLLEYNPLINYSMKEALEQLKTTDSQQNTTQNVTTQGTAESSSNDTTDSDNTTTNDLAGTSDTNEVTSNYPQQAIAGGDFADGARDSTNETTTTGTVENEGTTSTISSTEASNNDEQDTTAQQLGEVVDNTTYEKNIEGLTGLTYQDLIMKERDTMLRIAGMVIEEMKPCFILIY